MKTTMKVILLFCMLLIFNISCSKDDDDSTPTINATNFTTTIDENPAANSSLGTVSAAGSGTLTYSISSQIPNGAMSINSTTGELKVVNASLFDFETNPNIDAVITILNAEATTTVNATVNLNNIDDIEFFLTSSKSDYTAAADGNWVEVTETEYNNLANSLNEVSKVGTSDAQYNVTSSDSNDNPWTIVNDTGSEVPSGGYVFAFKYFAVDAVNVTGFKVKQSETIDDNLSDLGNSLPMHSATSANVYFVLKGNSSQLTSQGYVGVHKPAGFDMGYLSAPENYYFINGDVNTGLTSFGGYIFYQGLSTTQKQWD